MGWTYGWDTPGEIKAMLRGTEPDYPYELLDEATTHYGRHWWTLHREKATGKTVIGLTLIDKSAHGWGYKCMDETMGPYEYDCPLRLLDAAGPPLNEWAAEWRTKVRAAHADRTAKLTYIKTLKVGDTVALDKSRRPAGPFTITSVNPLKGAYNGIVYRLPKTAVVPTPVKGET